MTARGRQKGPLEFLASEVFQSDGGKTSRVVSAELLWTEGSVRWRKAEWGSWVSA